MTEKIIIGKEEWIELPKLGLPAVKARIDSGAKTSSLHAFNMELFEKNGKKYVEFDIHPLQKNKKVKKKCRAQIIDKRQVKSSSGESEKRFVINTPMKLGEETWTIQVTLTNRDSMGYRMLLGREAMEKRILIDPDLSFCKGKISNNSLKELYIE